MQLLQVSFGPVRKDRFGIWNESITPKKNTTSTHIYKLDSMNVLQK